MEWHRMAQIWSSCWKVLFIEERKDNNLRREDISSIIKFQKKISWSSDYINNMTYFERQSKKIKKIIHLKNLKWEYNKQANLIEKTI